MDSVGEGEGGKTLSCIGEGNGNPLQCSCLENPRDGGACGLPLRGLQESRVATREESGVLGFPSRQGLTPRVHQESNPEIPVPPGDEHYVLDAPQQEKPLP